MQKIVFIGNLTKDAASGTIGEKKTPVLNFTVASNSGYDDHVKTSYFDCAVFAKRAEGKLGEHLKKGVMVYIEGDLSVNPYINNDGEAAAFLNVRVQQIELLGSSSKSSKIKD